MSPRTYQLGKRQEHIDDSRRRIVQAARALLAESTSYTAFTVDAVAKKADVARATVYYQFDNKTGLLEALCDSLAEEGRMSGLATAFKAADPRESLSIFLGCFARFWAVDRTAMRRLRALAALDPEVATVIAARDSRRESGLEVIVARLTAANLSVIDPASAVRLLYTLTSFETFDQLALPTQSFAEALPLVEHLCTAAITSPQAV